MSQNGMTVELLLEKASQGLEEAAIIREAVEEAWQALEQALIQLEQLPPALAWQVLLAPFGLRVLGAAEPAEAPRQSERGGVRGQYPPLDPPRSCG